MDRSWITPRRRRARHSVLRGRRHPQRGRRRGRAQCRRRQDLGELPGAGRSGADRPSWRARFGSQCVVVGIDSQTTADGYRVYQYTGDPDRSRDSGRDTLALGARSRRSAAPARSCSTAWPATACAAAMTSRSCWRCARMCDVPLVASGGAGAPEHFAALFEQHAVDAALAASVFHSGQIAIPDLKQYLRAAGHRGAPMNDATCWTSTRSTGTRATDCCPASCRTRAARPC